jgi:hypothetical protein
MHLINHLNDEELTELLLERDEHELQQTLSALPGSLRSVTDLPDFFWQGQRAAIRRRIAAPPRAWLRPVLSWTTAMALVILALMLLRSGPAPKQSQLRSDPDQELLVAVEQTMQSEVPSALEPAALLADEIGSSITTRSHTAIPKENRNEN